MVVCVFPPHQQSKVPRALPLAKQTLTSNLCVLLYTDGAAKVPFLLCCVSHAFYHSPLRCPAAPPASRAPQQPSFSVGGDTQGRGCFLRSPGFGAVLAVSSTPPALRERPRRDGASGTDTLHAAVRIHNKSKKSQHNGERPRADGHLLAV